MDTNNDRKTDWIDDYAVTASKEQLIEQRNEMMLYRDCVDNYQDKLERINKYINEKSL